MGATRVISFGESKRLLGVSRALREALGTTVLRVEVKKLYNSYLRPDGVSQYEQSVGTYIYLRPISTGE